MENDVKDHYIVLVCLIYYFMHYDFPITLLHSLYVMLLNFLVFYWFLLPLYKKFLLSFSFPRLVADLSSKSFWNLLLCWVILFLLWFIFSMKVLIPTLLYCCLTSSFISFSLTSIFANVSYLLLVLSIWSWPLWTFLTRLFPLLTSFYWLGFPIIFPPESTLGRYIFNLYSCLLNIMSLNNIHRIFSFIFWHLPYQFKMENPLVLHWVTLKLIVVQYLGRK